MEKILIKIKNNLYLCQFLKSIFPGLIVLFLLSINFFIYDLFPFGQNTLAWGDMKQQVIPLFLQFKNIIESDNSALFFTGNSAGVSLIGILFFFISSPFTLFIKFINNENLILYVNIFIAIKISFSSIFAYVMFSKIYSNLKYFPAVILSLVYAFSGFNLMFYQNIVWLDISYLFPLLVLGLFKLIKYNKISLYIISLTLIIITNYYMSYMVFIFLIIFGGIYLLKTPKACSLFCIATLLPLFLSSIIIVPSFIQYLQSARTSNIIENLKHSQVFTHLTSFSTLLSSSILLLIIYFLLNKKDSIIPPKKLLFIFIALLIPIFIEPINKMWHTGSYQAFPARFSYITLLIGLIILGHYFNKSSLFSKNKDNPYQSSSILFLLFQIVFLIFIVLLVIFILTTKKETINSYTQTLWTDLSSFKLLFALFAIFGTYLLLVLKFKSLNLISLLSFKILISLILITEIFLYCGVYLGYSSNNTNYYNDVYDLQKRIESDDLSRVKLQDKYFDVNLTGGLGYNSMATYTSLTSKNYLKTAKLLGFSSYWMEVSSSQGTMFSDALMSNKYIIQENNYPLLDNLSNIIYKNDSYTVYENMNILNIAVPFSKDNINNLYLFEGENRFKIQNRIFKAITDSRADLFKFYSPTETITSNSHENFYETTIYNIDIKGKKVLYFDYFDKVSNKVVEPINKTFDVRVNGIYVANDYPNKKVNGILYLGAFEDESVRIVLYANKKDQVSSFGVVSMDYDLFSNSIQTINSYNYINSATIKGNKISLNISESAYEKDYLLLSIPYNGNIIAKSKGDILEVSRVLGSFIALELPENKSNNITITFIPKGINTGMILTIIGFILSILVFTSKKYNIKMPLNSYKNIIYKICSIMFFSLFILTLIIVYTFPMLVMLFY